MDEIRHLIERAVAAHKARRAGRPAAGDLIEKEAASVTCGECIDGWVVEDGRARRCPCVLRRRVGDRQRAVDAVIERHRAGMGRRLRAASEMTWQRRPNQDEVKPILDDYLRRLAAGESRGLLLYGPPGAGKSWASAYVVNVARARRILPAAYVHFARILGALKGTFRDEAEHKRLMDILYETPLLAIDDLGMEQKTAEDPEMSWSASEFYKVIDYRHDEELPTLITTNRSLDELGDRIGAPVVARIQRMCVELYMPPVTGAR